MFQIRDATAADLDGIFAIYDEEIAHGVATFDTEPYDAARRARWFASHGPPRHPVLVAYDGARLAAWASLSQWSDRAAYARTAEPSVYVDEAYQRRGLGRTLMLELIARARASGLGVLMSRITSESQGSIELHRALGFTHAGTLPRVGEKHGRVLDVDIWCLPLDH